jgi:regulator of sigma E protease
LVSRDRTGKVCNFSWSHFASGASKLSFLSLPILYAIPAFILVLTVIVFVHEMGHYLVARWNGIAIQTFSIGFGRELWGFNDRHGTRWKFSAIPLGGYVRFVGDLNAASMPDPEAEALLPPEERKRLFINKNVWQRMAVVVAGPAANLLFTFLVLYALLIGYGRFTITPVIGEVIPGGVAAEAGLMAGDLVTSADGFTVRGFEDFQRLIATSPGRAMTVNVERGGESLTFVLTPASVETTDRFGNPQRIGRIGVSRSVEDGDVRFYRPDPSEAVAMTLEDMQLIVVRTASFIGDLFTDRRDFRNLGGPVEIAKASGEIASLGPTALVFFMATVSLSIGIFNLLPIPMLDGGHLVFYIAEAIRGRPLSQRVQELGFRIGFAAIMSLFILVLVTNTIPNTLPRLFSGIVG